MSNQEILKKFAEENNLPKTSSRWCKVESCDREFIRQIDNHGIFYACPACRAQDENYSFVFTKCHECGKEYVGKVTYEYGDGNPSCRCPACDAKETFI